MTNAFGHRADRPVEPRRRTRAGAARPDRIPRPTLPATAADRAAPSVAKDVMAVLAAFGFED